MKRQTKRLIYVGTFILTFLLGGVVGVMLTAGSFYYIYGVHQTPYEVQGRYDACAEAAPVGHVCILEPIMVGVKPE